MGPAETTNFMILGFALIYVPTAIYVWSLYARTKKLKADLALIDELED